MFFRTSDVVLCVVTAGGIWQTQNSSVENFGLFVLIVVKVVLVVVKVALC